MNVNSLCAGFLILLLVAVSGCGTDNSQPAAPTSGEPEATEPDSTEPASTEPEPSGPKPTGPEMVVPEEVEPAPPPTLIE